MYYHNKGEKKMYSRRTGILQTSTEGLKKIENFNKNLREQYNNRAKSNVMTANTNANNTNVSNKETKDITQKIGAFLGSEELILIALILFLMFDINKDYLIIGILAMLLLLN